MTNRSIFGSLLAFMTVAALCFVAPEQAYAAGDCGGGWVDGVGTSNQSGGCAEEDTHLSGTGRTSECYGQCGKGCSWYNCGSGGACETHDYYTRTQGMFSWAALSRFPAAIVQWGSCVTGRGSQGASANVKSKTTGYTGGANPRVR